MAGPWEEWEYEELFRDHAPTEPQAPDRDAVERMARKLDRSTGAVKAQWQDARDAVLDNTSAGSDQLKSYLSRRGWA